MEQMFGIDISKWQGDFNLEKAVKEEGVQFVIIKAGGGDKGLYTDKQWVANYKKAKLLGIPVGAYWYSKATSVDAAITEARYFYQLIQDKQLDLPVYMDVEEKCMFALGADKCSEVVAAFCKYIEDKGWYTGIYSSVSYFKTHLNKPNVNHFTHWVAGWRSTRPEGSALWQFGGETNVVRSNKICGQTVDQDYLYTDFMSAIRKLKLNGYGRKPESIVADEVIDGLWGVKTDRVSRLTAAGYNYETVQALVNQKMKERK